CLTCVRLTPRLTLSPYTTLFRSFCLQLITGLIRRDPTALSRAALGLAKAVLGSFVAISITGLLLEVTDQLTIGIVQATGNTMKVWATVSLCLPRGLSVSISLPQGWGRSSRSSSQGLRSVPRRSSGSAFSFARRSYWWRSYSPPLPCPEHPGMPPRGGLP